MSIDCRLWTIFLAGSYLVKSAIGEDIDNETLGGAVTHSEISGVTDYNVETDEEALDTIKDLMLFFSLSFNLLQYCFANILR